MSSFYRKIKIKKIKRNMDIIDINATSEMIDLKNLTIFMEKTMNTIYESIFILKKTNNKKKIYNIYHKIKGLEIIGLTKIPQIATNACKYYKVEKKKK